MTDLEIALRYVGFAVAVLGTCAAVPAATWRVLRRASSAWSGIVDRLLRRSVPAAIHVSRGEGTFAYSVSAIARSPAATGGSIEELPVRVEQQLVAIDEEQQQVAGDLRRESTDRTQADTKLWQHLQAEVARIDPSPRRAVARRVGADARALPVVLSGALLSTFPELLGANAVVGTAALSMGVGLFFRAWALLDAVRPAWPLVPPDANWW